MTEHNEDQLIHRTIISEMNQRLQAPIPSAFWTLTGSRVVYTKSAIGMIAVDLFKLDLATLLVSHRPRRPHMLLGLLI